MANTGLHAGEALGQRAMLAPSLLKGLELLALPTSELSGYLMGLAEANPMLDIDFYHPLFSAEHMSEEGFQASSGLTRGCQGGEFNPMVSQSCLVGSGGLELRDYIRLQVPSAVAGLSAFESVLDALDENGYFRSSLEEVCLDCGSEEEARIALDAVRCAEPRGVGAFDLRDCLLLQLNKEDGLARMIVEDYLDEVPKGHPGSLARKLEVPRAQVVEAVERIAACEPFPGRAFCREGAPEYEYPDLLLEECDEGLSIAVVGSSAPPLVLQKKYLGLMSSGALCREDVAYFKQKKREADDAIRNVEFRFKTIAKLGNYLLKKEYGFFSREGRGVTPLSMQDVARDLGVHPTTVSRAVSRKSIATPFGTFPLRIFFSASYETGSSGSRAGYGGAVSSFDVKRRIRKLIDGEDGAKPLSDNEISKRLGSEGAAVSRRTVAKYRESMGIPSSSERRAVLRH